MNKIINEDFKVIYNDIEDKKYKFKDSNILITGFNNYLGYYLLFFFDKYKEELKINSIRAVDNFQSDKPNWVYELIENGNIDILSFDFIKNNVNELNLEMDDSFVIYMDPSNLNYIKYPIETIKANNAYLNNIFEKYRDTSLKGFLYFSSSDVYGKPTGENIPTLETYNGNVSTIGSRSIYEESKRLQETICFSYNNHYKLPTRIVRTFNTYGPNVNYEYKEIHGEFAVAVANNEDIVIRSDGTPTRAYCYISDAVAGYLKVLLHENFGVFNIGIDTPEISVSKLAKLYLEAGKEIFSYDGKIISYKPSREINVLNNNYNRKCPSIDKAKEQLDYNPKISIDDGVRRFLEFIKIERENNI